MKTKIQIENYNPDWAKIFKDLSKILLSEIEEQIISIEHVGSTSVIGLKAKPILDIDIIIENEKYQTLVIEKLKDFGYNHLGNLGITGREAFKRENDKVPFTQYERFWMKHNLYLCTKGSIGLNNHLILRDYLKTHPEAVEEYGSLKEQLAKDFPYAIDKYIEGKTAFITSVLEKEGMNSDKLNLITKENKAK